ncbi:leucine-rich PPR motif-containing protein, mitochondrial [Maniola hyperantus]|uniref:leucine-rich PPR motif-containing protein, mitochondrial n=1 Tax=Aphantopus hyperantus TaxID=2795564 RepID=UPI001569C2B2|nr:leucine-rich PPR motif-containing protein, mitochondrial [Maniola hyperantus]
MSSLLRSTKLVRYFTGAARTLILNSAKTADANLLINPKALSASNNVLMRDYATNKSESLDPLLQKLDLEVRKFGRITKKDIDEVFDELRANHDITSSQSLLVIRCCGDLVPEELPEQRTLLVQKIWNVLTERGIPMDVSHYNALLRVYIENEHPFSPAKFLEEMERKGLQPNRVTYQRLMWRYCQEGDVDGATKVLEKMRELNMPVSEPVLNALIMGHAFHGDTDGAKAVLDTMAGAGLKPSNRTYALLACGYAKQGDIVNVENIITAAKEEDNHLTDKDLLDIVEQLALGGHGDKVEQIFSHLHKSAGYNQEVCNLILKLLNKGHEDIARKIMKTMPKASNQEDTMFKGAFYIKHLLKVKKSADEIIQSCRELQNEDLVPNALYIATEASLNQGRTELAQKLFKELQKDGMEIRQHYYWPLLVQKGKERDEEGLLQILRNMANEGLTPTGEALRDYVIPYMMEYDTPQNIITKLQLANVPTFHSARNVMVELLHAGEIQKAANIAFNYRPRGQYALIRRPLINAFNKTKDIKSFVNILHVISSGPIIPQEDVSNEDLADENVTTNEIGRTLKSGIKVVARDNMVEALLTKALAKGLRINTAAAEDIQQYLGNNMTTRISELLTELTSPDLEIAPLENSRRNQNTRSAAQLEKLLEQVQSKDGNNINRLRKQVLQAYIQENNVEKVNSLVEEFKSQADFELTLYTLAQLFEFYCNNDLIDKAFEMKAQITAKDPEFVLNKFKTVQMAYALVRANRYEEAVQFLKDNKSSSDVENTSFLLNSKAWQMLNFLAETKDEAKVKEMTAELIDNGYIEPSNVILGPLIKVHLLKDDIESALKEFEHCCQKYRSTPWKGELMKALILKEDATKLQWLADLSTQIHGEVNILHDLVLAFVECGRLRQARRILETPGLQTRHKRLTDACLRYVEEGKSEYLEGLLEATKELSHIDRSNIFYHLLVSYCKADETDKALGLWTVLQEEGEVPSDQFLVYLGNHLKSKDRQIPFVIPELVAPKTEQPKTAIQTKKSENEQPKPVKKDVTAQIEKLTQDGKTSQALECALKSIEDGVFPKANVLKFLLKNLAEQGEVEKLQALGKHLNEAMRRNVTYDDKLTLAEFIKGNGAQHVDNVLSAVESATTDEEIVTALRKFPRSSALARAVQDEDLVTKCHKVAELAASKGHVLPANLLWMEYLLTDKDSEADSLWKKCLQDASVVVFRRLLQESHTRREPQRIEKLIETLKTNKQISPASIGNAYSRLINLYLVDNKIDEAKEVLDRALNSGIASENLNKTSIKRLKEALEANGKKFDYIL